MVNMKYETKDFTILWGDASQAATSSQLEEHRNGRPFGGYPWDDLKGTVPNLDEFFFAHQVHGVCGQVVTRQLVRGFTPLSITGDYLLTDVPGIGIGVLTADCLPIAIYDPCGGACAIIHAGWRGSVTGIVAKAVAHMKEAFNSKPSDLQTLLGPCAGICCYKVGTELLDTLGNDRNLVTKQVAENTYFDLAGYNVLLMERMGIPKENIDRRSQVCTICNTRFCSYRREKENAARQITMICLKNSKN